MAVETISRLFSQFQEHELLLANRKQITLLDLDGLRAITSNCSVKNNNSHVS
jgi:hypothetical protein